MAIGARTFGAAVTGSSAATLAVPYPASPVAGELLVLVGFGRDGNAVRFTEPAGWTTVRNVAAGASNGSYAVFIKLAAGGESGTLTLTSSTGANTQVARMFKVSGASLNFVLGTQATHSANPYVNGGVTPTENGALVVQIGGTQDCITNNETDGFGSWSGGTNVGAWTGASAGSTSGSDAALGIGTAIQSTAAATGNLTANLQAAQATYLGSSFSFAILPAAAVPPVDLVSAPAAGVGGASGTMSAGVLLSGAAAGQAGTAQGGRITDEQLTGAAAGTAAATGSIGAVAFSGTAAGQGGATASPSQVRPLSGAAAGVAGATGANPTSPGPFIGTVTYPTATTWECVITGLQPGLNSFDASDGTDTIQVDVTYIVNPALVGAAAGQAQASGGAGLADAHLAGAAAGDAEGSGAPLIQPPLGGAAAAQAGAVGTLSVSERPVGDLFIATANDGSAVTFGLAAFVITAIDGTSIAANIAPTNYYGPGVSLSGAAAGHAGATAAPGVFQALAGTAAGQAASAGGLDTTGLRGTAAGQAGAAATLAQQVPLAGTAAGAAGATATGPQLPIPLSGTAAGQAGATGEIGKVPLAGSAAGAAQASGALTQTQALSGVAAGHADVSAEPSWEPTPAPDVTLELAQPDLRLSTLPRPRLTLDLAGLALRLWIRKETTP